LTWLWHSKETRGPLRLRSGQAFDCVRLAPHFAQDDNGFQGRHHPRPQAVERGSLQILRKSRRAGTPVTPPPHFAQDGKGLVDGRGRPSLHHPLRSGMTKKVWGMGTGGTTRARAPALQRTPVLASSSNAFRKITDCAAGRAGRVRDELHGLALGR
jgi:hypothetical protein